MHVSRNAPSGFTLIELLVVVAIIALLVTILAPSLSRAKHITKVTVCGANMRQLGEAMFAYSQDCAGWLPCHTRRIGEGTGRNCWDVSAFYVMEMEARGITVEQLFCSENYDIARSMTSIKDGEERWWFDRYVKSDKGPEYDFYRIGLWDWVPRPGNDGPPDPDWGPSAGFTVYDDDVFRGPVNMSDTAAMDNPIVTDVVASTTTVDPNPIGVDLSRTAAEEVGLSRLTTHMYRGYLDQINAVYADGHRETVPAGQVEPRFHSNVNDCINWR